MPRAKRGFKARRRRNRVLNQTEGYFLGRKNRYRQAVEVLRHAWEYGYISRRLKKANVSLDRKILSELAIHDPAAFGSVAKLAGAKAS